MVILVFVDTALGIWQAIAKPEIQFDVKKLPQFLKTKVLPYLGGLTILCAASMVVENGGDLKGLAIASMATYAVAEWLPAIHVDSI